MELETELVNFEQDDTGVTAHIRSNSADGNMVESFRASYLVGADGAKGMYHTTLMSSLNVLLKVWFVSIWG